MSILVVDDAAGQRLLISAHLRAAGHPDLVTADSAAAAFDALGMESGNPSAEIDVILMDIEMPEIDGISACRTLKAHALVQDIPVIIVTASTDPQEMDAAFEAGAFDFLNKPVKAIELIARVRAAMRLKQQIDRRKAAEAALVTIQRELSRMQEQPDKP